MPIKLDHPVMSAPSQNVTLWRYMDIPSFLSLLTTKSLTFVRSGLMEDKFEGKLPKATIEVMRDYLAIMGNSKGIHPNMQKAYIKYLEEGSREVYINCWCKESHEMVHMWKIYSKENGVAVETTFDKLKSSLITDDIVYPTEIRYLDYKEDLIDRQNNVLTAYTIKRNEYKSENEVRLIISSPKVVQDKIDRSGDSSDFLQSTKKAYIETPVVSCTVDLKELISRIYLSPYAPQWYHKIIVDIIKKYDLGHLEVVQSDL